MFKRHLAWMSLSQICFFLLQFGGSVFLARLLSPYELGIYSLALAVTGIISIIQAFGLGSFIVREPDLDEDIIRSVFTVNLLLSLFLSTAIIIASHVAGILLREPKVKQVMLVLALLPMLSSFEFLPFTQLERAGSFKIIALVNTGRTFLIQSVTVTLALLHFSSISMAYGQVSSSLFSLIAYNLIGRRFVSFRLGMKNWRRILSFGVHMIAISGVNSIAARASEAVLGRIIGLNALGLYSRASNLNNLVWENIHLVIGRVVFVDLAAKKRAGDDLRTTYLMIVEILTALLWPAFAGLAIVSGPFIRTVYGAKWVAAAHPLTMLSLSAILLVSISMTWELFVVCGETGRQMRIESLRTGAGLAMFTGGCFFGLTGAAAGRVAEAAVSIFLYRPHLDRMTSTRTRDFIPVYVRSALFTAVAIGPAAIVMAWYRASEDAPLTILIPAIFAGSLLWVIALFWSKHPLASEVSRQVIKRLRRSNLVLAS